MTVTVAPNEYPGLSEVLINFGLGRAPNGLTYDQIKKVLAALPTRFPVGRIDNVGGLRAHEGVWGVNRIITSPTEAFTPAERETIRQAVEALLKGRA